MTKALGRLAATIIAVATGAACTVHQADSAPPLTGPSGLAQSVTITATPDSITRDGQSQSAVVVRVIDANGQPAAGVAIRMDMLVDGSVVDFGTLAARTIATGADGRALNTYTAPPAPPTSVTATTSRVTIRATPIGSDAQASNSFVADIRLVPVGVILGPGGTPTPSFTWSPTTIVTGLAVNFDASASTSGSDASSIASYAWTFGDGTTGTGRTTTHTFTTANTFNVTLTVTNDRGGAASTTHAVTVTAVTSAPPSPVFNFSPSAPGINETVFFNATASSAAAGRAIVSYRWIFGDGSGADGVQVSHAYRTAGTYIVTLTVTDDLGQSGTASQNVTPGSPPLPTPKFTFSPALPTVGESVLFSAATSTTAQGQTITDYFWNFGDDPSCPAVTGAPPSTCYVQTSSPTYTRSFPRAGTFAVNLVIKDSAGRIAATVNSVTVGTGIPVASILVSPSPAVAGATVTLNGSGSTAAGGQTIASYSWSINGPGLSVSQSGSVVSQTFPSAGAYTVALTVTDTLGRIGTTSTVVNVTP
jgi:PKD repeat protein